MTKLENHDFQVQGEGLLRLAYIPVTLAVLLDGNPKLHDESGIKQSIREYGFQDPGKWDTSLESFVFGNGRTHCVQDMMDDGEDLPAGIAIVTEGDHKGEWAVPVIFGNDLATREKAEAFAIDHNNLTLTPGITNPITMAKIYNRQKYASMLKRIKSTSLLTVTKQDADKIFSAFNPDPNSKWKQLISQSDSNNSPTDKSNIQEYKFSFGDYTASFDSSFYTLFANAVLRLGTVRDVLLLGVRESGHESDGDE